MEHTMVFDKVWSRMAMPASLSRLLPFMTVEFFGGSVLLGRQEVLGIQMPSVHINFYANVAYSGPLRQKVQGLNTSSVKAGPRGSNHFVKSQVPLSLSCTSMNGSVCSSLPPSLPTSPSPGPCCLLLQWLHPEAGSSHVWPDGLQPLQMFTKAIADSFPFPQSSKIPWVGSHWTWQGKKQAEQPGQAWHTCPPWSHESRKARSTSTPPKLHGLSVEEG